MYLNLFNEVRLFDVIVTSEGKSLRRFFLLNEYVSHEIIVSWKFEVSLILYLGRYLFDYNVVVANAVG
jgi:hypothetical protein